MFGAEGFIGLARFEAGGSVGFPSAAQEDALKAFVAAKLPRSTRQAGAFIAKEFCGVYESRSGLIALLHRLEIAYRKPNVIQRLLDEAKQKAFIAAYENLLNSMGDDEAALLMDAGRIQPAPAGCFAPQGEKLATLQTSGRQRIDIHDAADLETGQPSAIAYHDRSARMIEAPTIDAASTIRLLQSIEALYPLLAVIHVVLDNARYRHARLVREWLATPGCRINLHFIKPNCPHLDPIARL